MGLPSLADPALEAVPTPGPEGLGYDETKKPAEADSNGNRKDGASFRRLFV
jgi:hypothetical protein